MHPFHCAQSAAPFDPALMLIQADWLEERGDAAGAAALRGLVAAGIPSLHALALGAALASVVFSPIKNRRRSADGDGQGEDYRLFGGQDGFGEGDGYGVWDGRGPGFGDRFAPEKRGDSRAGTGDGQGDRL